MVASTTSHRKQQANRANARKSTGPRTLAGKDRSSQNAITHGVFCRQLVLNDEEAGEFNRLRRAFIQRLRPQDLIELSFVERIVDGNWRLMRLAGDEAESRFDTSAESLESAALAMAMMGGGRSSGVLNTLCRQASQAPDRYGPARQRVEQSLSRALRELRTLQHPHKPADLPPSPYLDEELETPLQRDSTECNQMQPGATASENPQNEPTATNVDASPDAAAGCDAPPISSRMTPPANAGLHEDAGMNSTDENPSASQGADGLPRPPSDPWNDVL